MKHDGVLPLSDHLEITPRCFVADGSNKISVAIPKSLMSCFRKRYELAYGGIKFKRILSPEMMIVYHEDIFLSATESDIFFDG